MTDAASPPVCHALWIGPSLGPLERACLSSFVEAGHPVRLHAYEDLPGVPPGVTVRDAGDVLPREAVLRHRATGSVSLFSNRFRYALLRRGGGVWIDCDVLCVRPLPDEPFLFGRQDARRINGAVLRLPPDHPVLDDLAGIFERPRWVPPWLRIDRRFRRTLLYRRRPGYGVADMPWGTAGPDALTWYLARHGLEGRALPEEVLYPLPFPEARSVLVADGDGVAPRVTDRTRCLHLWHQALGPEAGDPAPGSFLAAVLEGRWRARLASAPVPASHAGAGAVASGA
jgi:hypothetical protein